MWRSLVLITFALGCGSGQKEAVETPVSSAEKIDLNGDGKPDAFKYYGRVNGELVLLKKEIDLNIDGKIDVWRYYDDKGEKIRDEMDMDFDGKVDATSFYADGEIIKKEIDLAFDQTPDQTKYYRKGKLNRVEWDTNSDGKVDYWEVYKGGKLHKKGIDADGDGQPDPDKWTEIDEEQFLWSVRYSRGREPKNPVTRTVDNEIATALVLTLRQETGRSK